MIVLIPAYEPDRRLVDLVTALVADSSVNGVVVVDDGSGPAYADVFADTRRAGAEIVAHPVNRGKGCALRTGFLHISAAHPGHTVVCADCDGQHRMDGIRAVAERIDRNGRTLVLGTRRFVGRMPLASRVGNTLTRVLFARATGRRVFDTQTGLRGCPPGLLPWLLGIDGDRFEYELNVLLAASREGIPTLEVPVDTIYIDGNASTHFRPLVDSVRVYAPLVRFGASSISAFLLDFVLLFVLHHLTGNLLVSAVGARAVSSLFNFAVNRMVVFDGDRGRGPGASALRYYTLATIVLAANVSLLHLLRDGVRLPLVAAKIATELLLFMASYEVQRRFIFRQNPV